VPSKQLYIIRIALMTGVFMFAGLVLYQRRDAAAANDLVQNLPLEALRYVLWVLVGASALTALILRPRIDSAPPQRQALMTLIGWSFGEGVALLGIVMHFAGAPVSALSLGILAFVFALMLLPVPHQRR
jgi:FtsH-binding integral membrane protein